MQLGPFSWSLNNRWHILVGVVGVGLMLASIIAVTPDVQYFPDGSASVHLEPLSWWEVPLYAAGWMMAVVAFCPFGSLVMRMLLAGFLYVLVGSVVLALSPYPLSSQIIQPTLRNIAEAFLWWPREAPMGGLIALFLCALGTLVVRSYRQTA